MDGKDVRDIFGNSVKELRVAQNLTQEKLAELLNKDTSNIYRIESGRSFVSSDTIGQLTEIFNVHPAVLFTARPEILLKTHTNTLKAINQLLQTFSSDKLIEVYNILNVMNNK